MDKITIKQGVKDGQFVLLDTRTKDGKDHIIKDGKGNPMRVVVSRSLSLGLKMDLGHDVIAGRLMDSLNRTLRAKKFMGVTPDPILRVCVDAKENYFVESKMSSWDNTPDSTCIIFSLVGQMEDNGRINELSDETIRAMEAGKIPVEEVARRVQQEFASRNGEEEAPSRSPFGMPIPEELLGVKMPKEFGPEAIEALKQVLKKMTFQQIQQTYGAVKSMIILMPPKSEEAAQAAKDLLGIIEAELERRNEEGV